MTDAPGSTNPRLPVADAEQQPGSIRAATIVMYVRAVVSIVGLISALFEMNTLRAIVVRSMREHGQTVTAARADSIANAGLAVGVVLAITFAAFYVVLAVAVRRGKKWAWITTLVIAGLGVLSLLTTLTNPATGIGRTINAVAALLDLTIFVLLLLPEPRWYFGHRRT